MYKTKLAAIESEWETQSAPASFTLFGIPNQTEMRTDYAIKIPYALGLIATRSTIEQVTGIQDLMRQHEIRIRNGMHAYRDLEQLRAGERSLKVLTSFEKTKRSRLWSVTEKICTQCC